MQLLSRCFLMQEMVRYIENLEDLIALGVERTKLRHFY
jgi:hypothetical protein